MPHATLLTLALAAAPQLGGERALLIVDPTNADALYVANEYAAARALPSGNVLFLDPDAPDYASLVAGPMQGMLGEIRQRDRDASLDFVVLAPSDQYRVSADGLVNDNCAPVRNFGLASAYGLYDYADAILGPQTLNAPAVPNEFEGSGWLARTFRGADRWLNGSVVDPSSGLGMRMLAPARLGWTGERGNTVDEVVAMITRGVAAEASEPVGTFYYMQTTDAARSGPRHGTYPTAVQRMASAGGTAEHLMDVLPTGRHDALGVMTGWAAPDIDGADMTILPGAFADHLTSFAGHFGTSSQTKMSRWIAKGASGTAGAIEEPCNYAAKFPHARVHTAYRRGARLGEAWFRSVGAVPLQSMFLGDPLTRPWSAAPSVDVPDAPAGPVTGTITLTPSATVSPVTGNAIAAFELFVDGVLVDRIDAPGAFMLDTSTLAQGPHGILVRAEDDSNARFTGTWAGTVDVDGPLDASLSTGTATGDLATVFTLQVAATGGDVEEVVVRHLGRVVAATNRGNATVDVAARVLGAGPARLVAEARFAGGARAVSAPLVLDIDPAPGAPSAVTPVAYGYRRELRSDDPFVLDLPASFTDALEDATFELFETPLMSTVVWSAGSSLVLEPQAGAHGVDLLRFRVTTPTGLSLPATIQIAYADGPDVQVFCRASANSAGTGARLGWSGSTSLGADDLVLRAAGLPTQSFAIAFRGQGFGQQDVGNGTLCSLGTQVRLAVVQADVGGSLSWNVVNSTQQGTQAMAGSTWGFQLWHRDSIGAQSSFTDGLLVTFTP